MQAGCGSDASTRTHALARSWPSSRLGTLLVQPLQALLSDRSFPRWMMGPMAPIHDGHTSSFPVPLHVMNGVTAVAQHRGGTATAPSPRIFWRRPFDPRSRAPRPARHSSALCGGRERTTTTRQRGQPQRRRRRGGATSRSCATCRCRGSKRRRPAPPSHSSFALTT